MDMTTGGLIGPSEHGDEGRGPEKTTKAQMGQILGVLGVVYRRQALTTQELKLAVPVWHELLGDLDFDLLKAAVHAHCASSKWFPSVAELRQAAYDLVAADAEGVTAGEAWREVRRALRLGCHRFQSGEAGWSSPLVEAAFNALGGWNYFRAALAEDEMADRAHFTRAFEALQRRQRDQARMHPAARRFRQEYLERAPQLPPACSEPDEEIPEQLARLAQRLSLDRPVPRPVEGLPRGRPGGPVPREVAGLRSIPRKVAGLPSVPRKVAGEPNPTGKKQVSKQVPVRRGDS
jgi:hypothetical protein